MLRRILTAIVVAAVLVGAAAVSLLSAPVRPSAADTPIKHIVVIMEENHSFDNVLGKLCIDDKRCNGSLVGKRADGTNIPLTKSPDQIPNIGHATSDQRAAVDKGKMDGFAGIAGCSVNTHYACYSYFSETQIPNLAFLARHYAIADAAFSASNAPSWGGHLAMVMPDNGWRNGWAPPYEWDGFTGDIPRYLTNSGAPPRGQGWGCDSNRDAYWKATPTARAKYQPSCIPDANGGGAYRKTSVKHVPTILDSLDNAGQSWKIYGATNPLDNGYQWNICQSFAECIAKQQGNVVSRNTFAQDAAAGNLPAVSMVVPSEAVSEHNHDYMSQGDNWIGKQVNAVMKGADWSSTAIFITYDDCGCFYDHVNPNTPVTGWGIRVPMVIVSPFAKPGYTDSQATSSTGGMLAFIEHTFGLAPLGTEANLYDFANSFDFSSVTTTTATESTTSTTDTSTSTTDSTTSTTDTTTSTVPDTTPDTTDTTTTTDPNATFPFNTPGPTLAPNAAFGNDPT
jgi:phospholipase C